MIGKTLAVMEAASFFVCHTELVEGQTKKIQRTARNSF
jgi:hypothetical protein